MFFTHLKEINFPVKSKGGVFVHRVSDYESLQVIRSRELQVSSVSAGIPERGEVEEDRSVFCGSRVASGTPSLHF